MTKGNTKPFRILVIDDDPDILNEFNLALGSEGFDVDVLRSGKYILHNQFVKPDLFIVDYRLPDIDGIVVCRYLKASPNYREVPIIVISLDPRMERKALEAGARAFIEMPFDIAEVVNFVRAIRREHSAS